MRNFSGCLCLFLLIIGIPTANAQEITLEGKTMLFTSDSLFNKGCYRIPVLSIAPNGDLLALADERVPDCGDLRTNRNINLVMRRSTDGGESWGSIERIIDFPEGQSASDASLITDRINGQVLLLYNYMDLDSAPGRYCFHQLRSTDNGRSWSQPEDITTQITKPEWQNDFMFITSGGGIQTSTGKLLHCLVNLQRGVFVIASDDHGKNWYLIDTPIRPADESKIAELADGSWMINSRVNSAGFRYVYRSSHQGLNWNGGPDSALHDPGCNAGFISYSFRYAQEEKKILILSHPDDSFERKKLTVQFSEDEGKSWPSGKVIYEGSAGYSAITVLPGGKIGLLFEKDDYREIVFTHFTME